jgi:hypothetical protein
MRGLRHLLIALSLLLSTLPALAANNYQDMWWLPAESGWGLMVLQQGDTISAVMFHYRSDGKPAWYLLSSAPRGTEEFFTGTLYEVTGPALFSVFNPASVLPRNVGSMTLHFTALNEATLSFSIDGQSSTRNIERISFGTLDVNGIFIGSQSAVVTCNGDPQVGSFVFPAEIDIRNGAVRETRVNDSLLGTGGVFCDWSDVNFTQAGSMMQGTGGLACRNGDAAIIYFGNVEVEQMHIIDHAISINYRATVDYPTASASCIERGLISGTRLLNPN